MLVVGSAQSGAQIAEELYQHGRSVFLSVGSAGRAPALSRQGCGRLAVPDRVFRHHAGQAARSQRAFRPSARFGRQWDTLNLHQFARDGVTLLGHLRGASGDTISLAPDLYETLARSPSSSARCRR